MKVLIVGLNHQIQRAEVLSGVPRLNSLSANKKNNLGRLWLD
jgi:hypothetical protein